MMETDYDFSSLFERSEGDYAGTILERLFGGIIPWLQGEADGLGAGNWLSTIFGLFNTAGLLAVVIVTSYTIYTVIIDTASDGKTFGQQTDTKYTILRSIAGLIAFVPISGGYSLAQVVMLFLVLQGSALGDVVWTRTADSALRGQPLLAQATTGSEATNNYAVQAQLAPAFDALVMGHLCAINANSIQGTLAGNGNPDLSKPMVAYSSPVVSDDRITAIGGGLVSGFEFSSASLHHVIRFQDEGEGYGGRDNFCGGVQNSAEVRQSLPGTVSFADKIAGVRIRSQFDNYVQTINQLSARAHSLALSIYQGERDVQRMRDVSREAVRQAVRQYASGAEINLAFSDEETAQIHDGLLTEASQRGWLFAPAWQRGISMGASWYGSPDGDLRIEAIRENNLVEYLSGQGIRTGPLFGDGTARAMLAKATDDFQTWDMMSPYLLQLADPDASDAVEDGTYSGLTQESSADPINWIMQWIYRSMLNLFSPSTYGGDSSGYTDPMVQVSYQGKVLAIAGTGIAGGGLAGRVLSSSGGAFEWLPGVSGAAEGGRTVSGWAITIGMWLLAAGFIIGTMVPLIPFAFYFGAVLSWVMLVVESMFAVPLAVLTLFAPAREATLVGSWNKILLSIFGIFFRPFFTVVGLIFAMMVLTFALQYLYDLFYILMEFLVPSQTLWNMLMMMGFISFYVVLTVVTVLLSAQLITELGDGAMNWLGIGLSSLASKMDVGSQVQTAAGLGASGPLGQAGALSGPAAQRGARGLADRLKKIPGR